MKLDSLVDNMYLDKYVNRNFDSLETNQGLKTLETKYGIKFQSLSACINPVTTQMLTEDETKFIRERLKQISQTLFNEGTPILISVGGSNSVQASKELNKKGNKYNVTYVSFGNCCLVENREHEFERTFNAKTKELLGVKEIR